MEPEPMKPSFGKRFSRKVVPGLPRPATIRRQNSERRDKLERVDQSGERRTQSMDRRRAKSEQPASPTPAAMPELSAPILFSPERNDSNRINLAQNQDRPTDTASRNSGSNSQPQQQQRPMPPPSPPPEEEIPPPDAPASELNDDEIAQELEERWILNLSMHFRDRSPREKFFVTYAEIPTRWRRVTISCDYRDAPPDSLERDLQSLQHQRDKSARIYEAIRTSLPDIQFYATVTNLRLQTSNDDRLHVHVTEDVNEIIPYPSTNAVQHLDCRRISERHVIFDSHMSGFVYRVRVDDPDFENRILIKKEIPSLDSVEEFLYETNALHSLMGMDNVISFEGLVVDEENDVIKGLLIGYAEQGPLVDLIYYFKNTGELTWRRREKWAREIILGLSQIHEAGFVQGDFTLSNIVVDDNDTAQIIDINRRGCPVGWEPPEIHKMISSGQRISMYIGVKSDLFQLGMVLWALAMEQDEPERQQRPLSVSQLPSGTPQYFARLTSICLSETPKDRLSATDLLSLFPQDFSSTIPDLVQPSLDTFRPVLLSISSENHSDPVAAQPTHYSGDAHGLADAPAFAGRFSSIEMPFDGPGSYMVSRGRSPPGNTQHLMNRDHTHPSFQHPGPQYNGDEEEGEPQIVPISPMGLNTNNISDEMNVDSRDWDLIDSQEDEEERLERQRRRGERMRNGDASPKMMAFDHVDSGLADMDLVGAGKMAAFEHVDSGLADMDLVGVGENEMLKTCHDPEALARDIAGFNIQAQDEMDM